jgi:hypothetical protein
VVLHQHNTEHLLLGSKAAPEFSLRQRGCSCLFMTIGKLHGRNLASAFMRSRVHNRTRDRGGKPIWLACYTFSRAESPGWFLVHPRL